MIVAHFAFDRDTLYYALPALTLVAAGALGWFVSWLRERRDRTR